MAGRGSCSLRTQPHIPTAAKLLTQIDEYEAISAINFTCFSLSCSCTNLTTAICGLISFLWDSSALALHLFDTDCIYNDWPNDQLFINVAYSFCSYLYKTWKSWVAFLSPKKIILWMLFNAGRPVINCVRHTGLYKVGLFLQ